MSRPGLDAEVVQELQAIDELVRDMREGLKWPNSVWDEESAVERYLVYLSMLVDAALADIAMSAMIKNDIMVLIKLRLLVEYSTKAAYFDDHPDYALYMMTIGDAKDILHKLKDANKNLEAIANAETRLAEVEGHFHTVAHLHRLRFEELMTGYGDRDDYVWLYRAPSSLLHGDPDGMHALFDRLPDGRERPSIEFPLEHVNAMLVDAGTNCMLFCEHFIRRFHPDDEALNSRRKALHRRFLTLVLKHLYGRSEVGLEAVRKELAET